MNLTAKTTHFTNQNFANSFTNSSVNSNTDCAVVAVYKDTILSSSADAFQQSSGLSLTAMYESKQLSGKVNTSVSIYQAGSPSNILVVGFGKKEAVTPQKFRRSMTAAAKKLVANSFSNITLFIDEVSVTGWGTEAKARDCAQAITHANYQFTHCKSQQTDKPLDVTVIYATTNDDNTRQAQ
jgi:leucyl aminopeptidase